ncbi:hypothetical protein AMAG_03498 [Allomyces macrogynus ATCC 38327]|uniref:Uncharacterized protein n=1 Tax=Allomyces macrogynus (strain ATCC 38327) TaxID=578462 RepID=A0A0L0S9P5_ALLM3|nr:hypothetical protein AMAG_03498 [Allomyces macrogynus ATCC 38327]|eukprot:KNE59172.1 hypothetical protein AMAG_03498 [Allomyces macrogynus ATCC 38327]
MALPAPARGPPPATAARPAPPRLGLALPSRRLNAAPPALRTGTVPTRAAIPAAGRPAPVSPQADPIDIVAAVFAATLEIKRDRGIVRLPRDCNYWVDNRTKRDVLTAARAAVLAEIEAEVHIDAVPRRSTAEVRPAATETRSTAATAVAAATKAAGSAATGSHRAGALVRSSGDAGPTAKTRATSAAAARVEPSAASATGANVPRKVSAAPTRLRLCLSAAASAAPTVSAPAKPAVPAVPPERARKSATPVQPGVQPAPAPPASTDTDLMSATSSNSRALAILDARRTDAPAVAPTPVRAPPPPTTADVTRARLIKRAQSLPAPATAQRRRPVSAGAESQPPPGGIHRVIERPGTSPLLGRWEVIVKVGDSPNLGARVVDRARTASVDRPRETAERTRRTPSAAPSVPSVASKTAPIPASVLAEAKDEPMDVDVPAQNPPRQDEELRVRARRKRARSSHGDSQESAGTGPIKRPRPRAELPIRSVVPERHLPSPDIPHATVAPAVSPPKSPPRPASPPSSPRAASGVGADLRVDSVAVPAPGPAPLSARPAVGDRPPVDEPAPAPPPITTHVIPPRHRSVTVPAPEAPSPRPAAADPAPAKEPARSPPPPPTNLVSPPRRRSVTDPTQAGAQVQLTASPAPIGLGIATSPLIPRFSALNVAPKSGSPIASPENVTAAPSKPAPPSWATPSRAPPSAASWLIPVPPTSLAPPPPPPPAFPPPPLIAMSRSSIARPRWSLGGASTITAAPSSPALATAWWKRTPGGGDPTTPSNRLGVAKTTTPRRDPVRADHDEEEEHERDVSVFAYSESQRGLDRSVMDLERMLAADVDLLAGVNAAGSQESVDGSVTEDALDLLGRKW